MVEESIEDLLSTDLSPLCWASSRWACRVRRIAMVVTKKVQLSQIDSKWQSVSTGRAQ